jgi:hypothetical protein
VGARMWTAHTSGSSGAMHQPRHLFDICTAYSSDCCVAYMAADLTQLRHRFRRCSYYARELQRVYRGHLGRRATRTVLEARIAGRTAAVRHACARVIQACFRGFSSRKYRHDFYARKAYIAEIAAKGEALRVQLAAQLDEQITVRTTTVGRGPYSCWGTDAVAVSVLIKLLHS